jgi:hypothetical protein
MDGASVKPHIIVGLVDRYRSIAQNYRLKQGSRMTNVHLAPEIVERPSVSLRPQDRQSELMEFARIYESLVEVLCDAAQFGVSPELERKFQQARIEMVNRYVTLRVFLGAYLRPSCDDSRGTAKGIRFDAFDALLAPATLELFLQSDDGNTISRITRTREALNLYAEHLKQLIERSR